MPARSRGILVWSGVWSATPGQPVAGDAWGRATLLEEKEGSAYVTGRGGTLWIPRSHWKEISGEDL